MSHPIFFILFLSASVPFLLTDLHKPLVGVALLLAGHAYLVSLSKLPKLKSWILGLLSLGSLVTVYFIYRTILGPEPASSLLLLMAALKLQEIREPRDRIIFLFVIVLLTMYYLLFFQTILSTLYMIVMSLAVLVSFITIHTPLDRRREIFKSTPKLVLKDLLLAAPIFIVLFAFFPRFTTPWASLLSKEEQSIGFSEDLKPGDMANLAQSMEPAFRVKFPNANTNLNPKDYYWRGIVLEETDGWSWNVKNRKNLYTPKKSPEPNELSYTVTLEPRFSKNLFVLESTTSIRWNETKMYNPIFSMSGRTYKSSFPLVGRMIYHGNSSTGPRWKEALSPSERFELTAIKDQGDALNRIITELKNKNGDSALQMADAILSYIGESGFTYSLSTPQIPSLENFLLKTKIGFCEHFASAMASLMRLSGHPARVVTGFQGGEWNDFGDYLLVRDQHAHAWVEVYDEDGYWNRYDPTSAVNSIRIETRSLSEAIPELRTAKGGTLMQMYYEFAVAYDALENRYNQFLLNYNLDAQTELFKLKGSTFKNRMMMLGYALGISAVIYFFIYLYLKRRRGLNPADLMLDNLKFKLQQLSFPVLPSDGPKDLMEKVFHQNPKNKEEIQKHFDQWLQLRYGQVSKNESGDQNIRSCETDLFAAIGNRRYDSDVKHLHKTDRPS